MTTRRTFLGGIAASLVNNTAATSQASARPVICWLHSSAQKGVENCPVSSADFTVISADLPCHGNNVRPGEPQGLAGWRHRLEQGEDLLGKFAAECSDRLDKSIARDNTTSQHIFVGGVSRGAFAALHLSLIDRRFRSIACLAPLIDLANLHEFRGYAGDTLSLTKQAANLSDRQLFLSIESQDDRVLTSSSIDLVSAILAQHRSTDLTLHIDPGAGHGVNPFMRDLANRWIVKRSR